MAYYGLSHPFIAKRVFKENAVSYENGFQCGKAVSTDITPNYNEASLYGDNELAEYAKAFKDADVNLGVTTLPIEASSVMFGHKVDVQTGAITYGAADVANDVGYGFYVSESVNGVTKYVACFLPKVKFTEAAESYTTRGDSIEFKNPTLSGKASPDENGNWRYKETFDTENAAIEWLKEKTGIKADTSGTTEKDTE